MTADLDDVPGNMLRKPTGEPVPEQQRAAAAYNPMHSFRLDKEKSYQQQFADMYFLRLTKLKPVVDKVAHDAWHDTVIADENVSRLDRVLDIRQGELCWVTGTIYMDMPLKPNILEDVSKDRWISAPLTTDHYYSTDGADAITLEDESGRVRLVGDLLNSVVLVTGCIVSVMGTERADGELEVIDLKFPDLAPQPERWTLSKPSKAKKEQDQDQDMTDATSSNNKIALVSGLGFSGSDSSHAMELNLLLEFLLGETLDPATQSELSHISRVIIAGNSISTEERKTAADEAATNGKAAGAAAANKKYGYDSSAYNAVPSQLLDDFLASLLPSVPVTLMPGASDPANASYPQQPIHAAMFPGARAYGGTTAAPGGPPEPAGWFDAVTNPWEGEVDGWRVLGTGGQNLDDVFKYVNSDDRLGMMEAMCRWRCCAPTAPDTLWSYPFQDDDPFVMKTSPHLFFVGSQPEFGTRLIHGPDGQQVRLVMVPSFADSGEVVLVDTETLEVSRVRIALAA